MGCGVVMSCGVVRSCMMLQVCYGVRGSEVAHGRQRIQKYNKAMDEILARLVSGPRQTHTQTDRPTDRQTQTRTHTQTNRQTDRQTDRQTQTRMVSTGDRRGDSDREYGSDRRREGRCRL
eukprot:2796391-Rhodomonas_salina.1